MAAFYNNNLKGFTTFISPQSLSARLKNLANGYPAHAEYVPCVIRSFANLPMSTFLQGYEQDKEKLSTLHGMDPEDIDVMTYTDIACLIYEVKEQDYYEKIVEEATEILAAPFLFFWKRRKERNGQTYTSWTP